MGVCILRGGTNNALEGELFKFPYYSVFQASYSPYGDMEGEIPVLEGSMQIGNGPYIEGFLSILTDPVEDNSIVSCNNYLELTGDLLLPQGELVAGGELAGELILGDFVLTGIVPSIGNLEAEISIISGSLIAGCELTGTSSVISGYINAIVPVTGTLNEQSVLSLITGNCTAIVPYTCNLTGEFQTLTSGLTGHQDIDSVLTGRVTIISGSVSGSTSINGNLDQTIVTLSGYMTGIISSNGVLEGQLAQISNSYLQDAEIYDYEVLRFIRGQIR